MSLPCCPGGTTPWSGECGLCWGTCAAGSRGCLLYTSSFQTFIDIQGVEDFHGEMDFKVAGTKSGITAIQMDLKNDGLTHEIIKAVSYTHLDVYKRQEFYSRSARSRARAAMASML